MSESIIAALAAAGQLLLTALAGGLVLMSGYLALLTAAATLGRHRVPSPGPARRRFAVLIPAHDEELLLGRLLNSLRQADYPADCFHVYVVADNCSDATASLARAEGARVYERFDHSARGKGYALNWLLDQVRGTGERYDAYVILDADAVVRPDLLRRFDARLETGSEVVQAYYSVLNADQSRVASLRHIALAAVHYLRPLGRSALGLSCGLKGNGMCFAAPVVERFSWRWYALAEDVEFHLVLVAEGIRVDFAPEVVILADMPVSLAQAASQNARWEQGRLQLIRRHVPGLLVGGLRQLIRERRRATMCLDAAIEQLIPPLSVPFAAGTFCVVAGIALQAPLPAVLASVALAIQLAHLLAGMILVQAPWRAYAVLAYAPLYVAWKVGVYGRALLSRPQTPWVRTARTIHPTESS